MATLEIIAGMNAGQTYALGDREIVVGRESTCQVVLPHRTVSRLHCRILRMPDGYYIEDLQSVNGTEVNGKRIERRTQLADRDRIRIHDIVLAFADVDQLHDSTILVSMPRPPVSQRAAELAAKATALPPVAAAPAAPVSSADRIVSTLDARSGVESRFEINAQVKLKAMLEISQNLGSTLDTDAVLPKILDSLFRIFPQTDRGYILQTDAQHDDLVPKAIKHRSGETDTISPISGTVAERVLKERAAFLSGDAVNDDRLDEMNESIFEQQVRSVMCAPLMGPSHVPLGVIHVETSDFRHVFTQADLDVLVSVALLAGQAVDYARMHVALLGADRQKRDLQMAKEVQLHFLPSTRPKTPAYRFFDYYRPAEEVAGDYFDYVEMPDGRLALVIGDVAGKGVSAALLMARLCSDVRYALLTSPDPAEAMRRLNEQLCLHGDEGAFVTLVLCLLDPAAHTLTVTNAGHCPPLIRRHHGRTVEALFSTGAGLPLGVHRAAHYDHFTSELAPGDVVVCYTDGVSEAMNPEDQLYGIDNVHATIASAPAEVAHVGQALVNDVRRFAQGRLQSDDICLLCVARQ